MRQLPYLIGLCAIAFFVSSGERDRANARPTESGPAKLQALLSGSGLKNPKPSSGAYARPEISFAPVKVPGFGTAECRQGKKRKDARVCTLSGVAPESFGAITSLCSDPIAVYEITGGPLAGGFLGITGSEVELHNAVSALRGIRSYVSDCLASRGRRAPVREGEEP